MQNKFIACLLLVVLANGTNSYGQEIAYGNFGNDTYNDFFNSTVGFLDAEMPNIQAAHPFVAESSGMISRLESVLTSPATSEDLNNDAVVLEIWTDRADPFNPGPGMSIWRGEITLEEGFIPTLGEINQVSGVGMEGLIEGEKYWFSAKSLNGTVEYANWNLDPDNVLPLGSTEIAFDYFGGGEFMYANLPPQDVADGFRYFTPAFRVIVGEQFELGDVNCDGVVDLLDVTPFVDLLTSGEFSSKADINGDGAVDLLDVGPFVDLLTSG